MIELDYVITNGYVDRETILKRHENGWNFISTIPAILIHPHAAITDKATIFSKYTSSFVKDENEIPDATN